VRFSDSVTKTTASPNYRYSADGFMEQYKTNVFGVINVTNAFLGHMRQRGEGTIVVVGSMSGWKTQSPVSSSSDSFRASNLP
jgi:NAD(P)-dependent dehydrogenase (short-subunit alcohol dehydrogenase family)